RCNILAAKRALGGLYALHPDRSQGKSLKELGQSAANRRIYSCDQNGRYFKSTRYTHVGAPLENSVDATFQSHCRVHIYSSAPKYLKKREPDGWAFPGIWKLHYFPAHAGGHSFRN